MTMQEKEKKKRPPIEKSSKEKKESQDVAYNPAKAKKVRSREGKKRIRQLQF